MNFDLDDTQTPYQDRVAAFSSQRVAPAAAAIDEEGVFPKVLIKEAAALGLLGMTIPAGAGGAGRDYVSYALAIETLARASAVVAVIATVNNSLVAEPIAEFGSDAQKERWLARLASGAALGAFALSEEHAGSDAANQQTVAREVDGEYVLSGRKVWVANAEVADVAIVFARIAPAGGASS